jgi:predicted nucleic-acid-binding protein
MSTDGKRPIVAMDSNCLTYLASVINDVNQPSDNLADEKMALFRILVYASPVYYNNTVRTEYDNFSDEQKKVVDENATEICYRPILFGLQLVNNIAEEYNTYHKGKGHLNDCMILAEAELIKANVLLTYDPEFYENLRSQSPYVKLLKPSECWDLLSIGHGAEPIYRPKTINPNGDELWWRW